MSQKMYRLHCEYCGYNRYTDGTDITDLVPYKRSPVATGIPKYDPVTKKVVTKAPITLPKQFKCPKCGRLITCRTAANWIEPEKPKEANEQGFDTGSQSSPA